LPSSQGGGRPQKAVRTKAKKLPIEETTKKVGTGNRRDVLAGVCERGSDGKIFAEVAEVGGGERVSGWSECSGGGGGGGLAVCACGNREPAGNCVARDTNHRETEFAGAGGSVQRAEPHESGDAEPVCERATVRDDHDGDDAGTTNPAEREVVVLIVVVDS